MSDTNRLTPTITIEIRQQDFIPGFGAFNDDGSMENGGPAHVVINIGGLLGMAIQEDMTPDEIVQVAAETLTHEFFHVIQKWAGAALSEDRVEELMRRYVEKYGDEE